MFCTVVDNEYVEHFLLYYEQGEKNEDRKRAISAAKCELFFHTLEYTRTWPNISNVMHPQPIRLPNGTNNLDDGIVLAYQHSAPYSIWPSPNHRGVCK